MISWTVPFDGRVLTSSAERASSESSSWRSYITQAQSRSLTSSSGTSTGSYVTFRSESYLTTTSFSGTWRSATMFGSLGSTTSSSFSTQFFSGATQGVTDGDSYSTYQFSTVETTSESSSFSTSSSTALPTTFVETSSTRTFTFFGTRTDSATVEETAWSTSTTTNSENETETATIFTTTTQEGTVYFQSGFTEPTTLDTVTSLTETTHSPGIFKTIVQAETSEVLFLCSEPPLLDQWSQESAASDFVTTDTRFTLEPIISTKACSVVDASSLTSYAVSNSSLTITESWNTLSQSTSSATSVSYFVLPNSTTTASAMSLSVGTSNTTNTVFASNTLRVASVNTAFFVPTVATTQTVVSVGSSRKTLFRQSVLTTFKTSASASIATTRTISDVAVATLSSSFETTESVIDSTVYESTTEKTELEYTHAGASAITAEANTWSYAAPWCSTKSSPATSRTNLCRKGVIAGDQSGLYFSCASSFPLTAEAIYAQTGRKVTTLLPITDSRQTVSGDTLFWTTTNNNSEVTTRSMVVTAVGTMVTEVDNWPASSQQNSTRALHFGGRLDENQTVIEVAGPGVYQSGSETTLFDGNATARSGPNEASISEWQPLTVFESPQWRSVYAPLAWPAPRNSTALP